MVCTDEKTGIQALERLHPTKPVRPPLPERRELEYLRHGPRCLLATFVVPTGWVDGEGTARRTNPDGRVHIRNTVAWLGRRYPKGERVPGVMDNLNTPWGLDVCRLFARRNGVKFEAKQLKRGPARRAFWTGPRHRHVIPYTPKHGSWLNQIENRFSVLARRVLRRGEFHSAAELAQKILTCIEHYNT